jgi:diacylglycerol kinase (ATP)
MGGVLVVVNDLAGRAGRELGGVVEELSKDGPIELVRAESARSSTLGADISAPSSTLGADPPVQSDLVTVLNRALDARADRRLVVLGGDGSLNTALACLWARGDVSQCPVALVPLGTGNDFARNVGIPLDPVEAATLARKGRPRPVDLITDDAGGVVVNAMHVGVGADAATAAKPLKPYLHSAAFPVGAVVAGFRARGWRLRVEVDGRILASGRRRLLMAGLANAPSIAGGTATLAPGASVTDGRFDAVVSAAVGRLARVGYALGLIRGTHPRRDDVLRVPGQTMTISGPPFQVNADGDISEPVRRRTWTVRPGAWWCVLP